MREQFDENSINLWVERRVAIKKPPRSCYQTHVIFPVGHFRHQICQRNPNKFIREENHSNRLVLEPTGMFTFDILIFILISTAGYSTRPVLSA